ncbi:MAG: PEP-CTERM sorting domain-containing protein [Pirellulales bacterium]
MWTIQVVPDGVDLPSALAVELSFTHFAGSSTQPVGIIDNPATDTNTTAANSTNDSWYYNETSGGSGNILWNITDPAVPGDETQNPGANPFTGTNTEGLYTSGVNLFASIGSEPITTGAAVDTLQIVTDNGGGILRMGAGVIGQITNYNIAAKDFYIPGDFDGDGFAEFADFTLLVQNYNQVVGPAWDGIDPVRPDRVADFGDFTALVQNYAAGLNFGSGSGSGLGGGSSVPEPTSMVLLGLGLTSALAVRRRR